jgi:hypothetical protein
MGQSDAGSFSVHSAFGAANRARLIDTYFSGQHGETIAPCNAWAHVYRLLL